MFQKDGTFVDEIFVERNTLGAGSAWDVAFSRDPEQSFMYLADGMNEKVHVIKRNGLAARGESTTERRVGPDMAVPHAEVGGGDGRSR